MFMPACQHIRASRLAIAMAIAPVFRNVPSVPFGRIAPGNHAWRLSVRLRAIVWTTSHNGLPDCRTCGLSDEKRPRREDECRGLPAIPQEPIPWKNSSPTVPRKHGKIGLTRPLFYVLMWVMAAIDVMASPASRNSARLDDAGSTDRWDAPDLLSGAQSCAVSRWGRSRASGSVLARVGKAPCQRQHIAAEMGVLLSGLVESEFLWLA